MEQQQQPMPEGGKKEGEKNTKNSSGVSQLLKQAHKMLLGAGGVFLLGGAVVGCSGEKPEAHKIDVRVVHVKSEEKLCPPGSGAGGEAKRGKEEKKEDAEHWKGVSLSVIGDHVLSDGKYYLKTVEVEGKKRVAVWELIEGDIPSTMKPYSRVPARIDEKDGRLDFDGHIYFKARDPGAWEKGRAEERKRAGAAKKAAEAPLPPPEKKAMEKTVPYAAHGARMSGVAFEGYMVQRALLTRQGDGTVQIAAGSESRRWRTSPSSPPLMLAPPIGATTEVSFQVYRMPDGKAQLVILYTGPLVPLNPHNPRDPRKVHAPTYWEEVR